MELKEEKYIFELLKDKFRIIGDSDLIKDAMRRLYQAAPTDLTILITVKQEQEKKFLPMLFTV